MRANEKGMSEVSKPPQPPTTLFRNVRIFDGNSGVLSAPSQVLVRRTTIARISTEALPSGDGEQTAVLDGSGRVLMPGLIDAHWHAAFTSLPVTTAMTADSSYVHLVAGRDAAATLQRGFTTVRDAGGPTFGLKRAIDEGVVLGPRIYPSGAFISQTGGHGDFRLRHELPRGSAGYFSHGELLGAAAIADGVPEVTRAVREQLMLGASQIKMMAGGGVSSSYDPIDVTQYTQPELQAAVEAADNWGTYVLVHAYTPQAIQRAIAAGVRCIEHGQLADEPTVELMAKRGIWWCLQPFLDDEDAIPLPTPDLRAKARVVFEGTERAYALAKKHGVQLAWGTDTLFDARLAERQGAQLAKLVRWFTPAEVLKLATADNAALVALSGARNPYPGKLGVVEEGALADLLLVDGDPLENITLLEDPTQNLLVIMKDGQLVKNTLSAEVSGP
jgi:imidazolonepropionase-like amidohydrolase